MTEDQPEAYFENFCAHLGLDWEIVPTASDAGQKRPDYLLTGLDRTQFYVELKTITPNQDEAKHLELLYGGATGLSVTVEPGARLRDLIGKANPQLKAFADRKRPGVLVVLNLEPALGHHTEPYAVLTAMRGLDVVPVRVPRDPRESPEFLDVRSGPKKRMTPEANTTISAILVLRQVYELGWVAEVYHNRFGSRPLPVSSIAGSGVRHWQVRSDERDWEPLPSAV